MRNNPYGDQVGCRQPGVDASLGQISPPDSTPHVLHVLHSFPPASQGGIETYVLRLAQTQVAEGFRVTILAGQDCSANDTLWTEELVEGLRVLRIRPARRDLENTIINQDVAEVFERLRDESIDLFHVHHWHNTSGDIVTRAAKLGIPAIVTMHDYFPVCPWFFRMRDEQICDPEVSLETCANCSTQRSGTDETTLLRVLRGRSELYRSELSLARARFTLSNDQAAYLREIPMLQGVGFETLPLPEPELSPVVTGTTNDSFEAFRIVNWGGLVPGKGMHILLEACERLSRAVEVHHYGRTLDDDYPQTLRGIARRTRLVIHGEFDKTEMEREFARYDVAVFASLFRETHGYVVDEAMLLGLPVVVSDRGAPSERLGGRGVTFAGGDSAALASTLQRFLDDPSTLATLRGAERPAGQTMKEHWSHVRAVYERVVRE